MDCFYKMSAAENLSKDIEFHLGKAAECYQELASQTKFIGDRFDWLVRSNNFEPFKPLTETYKAMHENFKELSKIYHEETKSFSKNVKMMFDFSMKEFEGLEDVHSHAHR